MRRLDSSQCRAAFEIRHKKKDSARCCFGRTQLREVDVQCFKTMENGTHKRLTHDKFAYTVQSVAEADGFCLLRLRNPWGKFEWTGDGSDASPLWNRHKNAKARCKGGDVRVDGFFWMEWKDFRLRFQNVDVCHRSKVLRASRHRIITVFWVCCVTLTRVSTTCA